MTPGVDWWRIQQGERALRADGKTVTLVMPNLDFFSVTADDDEMI